MKLPEPYYRDDYITLYHGDSVELFEHIDADVMVADPPYGYLYESNWPGVWRGFMISNDESVECRNRILDLWGDKPALIFGSWKAQRPSSINNLLVWDKGNSPGMGDLKSPWGTSHEEIYVIGCGFTTPTKRIGSVLRYQNVPASQVAGRMHPNEKPVALMRHLIERCPDGVIVDPFAGSGSTLRAAKDLGRQAIGIEIDEQWLDTIAQRCAQEVMFS